MEFLGVREVTRRQLVQVVATVVVLVFGLGLWLSDVEPMLTWLRFYSGAVIAATAVLWLWESILWRTQAGQAVKSVPRNLNGTWKGTLSSFWVDPSTQKRIDPKTAYLVVRQTATSIRVILLTDESRSVSSVGHVSGDEGERSLDYMYLNRPQARVEDRSRMHHGSTSLDIIGDRPHRLRGRYWTDRDTRGELDFTDRDKRKVDSYEDAVALFKGQRRR